MGNSNQVESCNKKLDIIERTLHQYMKENEHVKLEMKKSKYPIEDKLQKDVDDISPEMSDPIGNSQMNSDMSKDTREPISNFGRYPERYPGIGEQRDGFIASPVYIEFIMGDANRRNLLKSFLGSLSNTSQCVLTRGNAKRVADMIGLVGLADILYTVIDTSGNSFVYEQGVWYKHHKYDMSRYMHKDKLQDTSRVNKAKFISECLKPGGTKIYVDDNVESYNVESKDLNCFETSRCRTIKLPSEGAGVFAHADSTLKLHKMRNEIPKMDGPVTVVWDFDCTLSVNHMYKLEVSSYEPKKRIGGEKVYYPVHANSFGKKVYRELLLDRYLMPSKKVSEAHERKSQTFEAAKEKCIQDPSNDNIQEKNKRKKRYIESITLFCMRVLNNSLKEDGFR